MVFCGARRYRSSSGEDGGPILTFMKETKGAAPCSISHDNESSSEPTTRLGRIADHMRKQEELLAEQGGRHVAGTLSAKSEERRTDAPTLESNVFGTALLFEGGSMRAAYTSAVATYLLERGVYFDQVYGVSAGSSNLVNYLSRDLWRTSSSFTEFMDDPRAGNVGTLLRGKGAFDAEFIYQQAGQPDGPIPFDFDTFAANPASCCVFAVDRDTGEDLFFTKDDLSTLEDLMVRVRASSTLPMFMPPPEIDGRVCFDGGFGVGGGLPLRKVEADGFERVVVIRTRKRGYRKKDHNEWAKTYFHNYPQMRDAALTRSDRYNEACDLLDEWERQGRAYVFYCDDLTLSGTERDVNLLKANYQAGYDQIRRDWGSLMSFVEAGE